MSFDLCWESLFPFNEYYFWKINQEEKVNVSLLLSYKVGDTAPPCTTRVAQSSSCLREKPPSFCRRQQGCFALWPHVMVRIESASRASDRTSALAPLLFLRLLVWVSGSQGDHQKQKPWDLNTWKTFSRLLRKTWQPSSFLHHCCQVHAGCQTCTLLKQGYRRKSITHNHFASCSEPAVMLDHHPHGGSLLLFTPQGGCFKNLSELPFSGSYPANIAIRSPKRYTHNPSKAQGLFSFLGMGLLLGSLLFCFNHVFYPAYTL